MAGDHPPSVHLIEGDGTFNIQEIETFVKEVDLAKAGLSYATIAILGPQSSGKSTLLNHLFGTNFKEMNALLGRSQTTKGVWLSLSRDVKPVTLIMDVEGTDGKERGEEDTSFEKQSSLFALAVSDILLVNMWCHDIGREQASNLPLLKLVFQMMLRLFTPRRTTLMFVIRDKTKTPLETLEKSLRGDIAKIWEAVPKPPVHEGAKFEDFFRVEVTGLPHYELMEDQFKEEVGQLRKRFENSTSPGGLAGDRRGVVPGSALPLSVQEIWRVIRENKDLNLPAHKVMVATVRCEMIAAEKVNELLQDEEFTALQTAANNGVVVGFGKQAGALLNKTLSGYDQEAAYFDESVRAEKRKDLWSKALEAVHAPFLMLLTHQRTAVLERFKVDLAAAVSPGALAAAEGTALEGAGSSEGFAAAVRRCQQQALGAFEQAAADAIVSGSGWEFVKMRMKLARDMEAHTAFVRSEHLALIQNKAEKALLQALEEPVAVALDSATAETWPSLRTLLADETSKAAEQLRTATAGFELEEKEAEAMQGKLAAAGREAVESKAREESKQALIRMKERFQTIFSRDADSMPRLWTGKENIKAITKEARGSALRLLSVLAAIRLDDASPEDGVDSALQSLLESPEGAAMAKEAGGEDTPSLNKPASALSSTTWEKIPPSQRLLSPAACQNIWRQFKAETEFTISQAMAAQEAHRRSNSWLPPPWAIVAMVVLGFNEFMALVRNPLLLVIVGLGYYVGKALWVQMQLGAEFEHGLVPGFLAIGTKFVPTLLAMAKRLYEDGQAQLTGHHHPHQGGKQSAIQMPTFPSESLVQSESSARTDLMNGGTVSPASSANNTSLGSSLRQRAAGSREVLSHQLAG